MSSAREGRYIVAAIGVFYMCTRVLKIGTGHIFALLITSALLWNARANDTSSKAHKYKQIEGQIRSIGGPQHFYVDSNAVDLFYDYLGWRKLNPDNYDRCVEAVDNILRILLDTEKPLVRCVDHYHIAADLGSVALNMMHGFVYVIDEPVLIAKLNKALSRLEGLISKYLRQMRRNCAALERAKGRRDVNWSFIHGPNVPHPFDASESTFNFYGSVA